MELGLSLGNRGVEERSNKMGFCMGLGLKASSNNNSSSSEKEKEKEKEQNYPTARSQKVGSSQPFIQLDLLPFSPAVLPRASHPPPPLPFPWLPDNLSSEPGSSDGPVTRTGGVKRRAAGEEVEEQSSPNSGTSSFMEFSLNISGGGERGKRESGENGNYGNNYGQEVKEAGERGGTTSSRGSDDEENGSARKKLRLSKEQSAFLEESFKEHHTLNPKQKIALAKQLNLRPRQVEVWFQNRRARTKLKQTEVDCEYLKRCCETLTEENRRLQKELQELRALKTSQPFFMHLPATTLTMCPSCERVVPTSAPASSASVTVAAKPATSPNSSTATPAAAAATGPCSVTLSLGKPTPMHPFSQSQAQDQAQAQAHQASS